MKTKLKYDDIYDVKKNNLCILDFRKTFDNDLHLNIVNLAHCREVDVFESGNAMCHNKEIKK